MIAEPENAGDFAEAVRAHSQVLVVGAGTKPRMSRTDVECVRISTRRLRGIVEYDPGEYTFTAMAGTPLEEIESVLSEKGQYLPFDPPFREAGATLGGTIAAGLSGPGRFRYGGVRDFILAVRFVDGNGELLRGGAKVVKNAAGFDLPKFLTGSMGRLGAVVEATFKVFPRPADWATVQVPVAGAAEAAERMVAAARARWELDALDYAPDAGALFARIGGPSAACEVLAREIAGRWEGAFVLAHDDAAAFWLGAVEFAWAGADATLVRVPLGVENVSTFAGAVPAGTRLRFSAGGDVAWVSVPEGAYGEFERVLVALGLSGVVLRGDAPSVRCGRWEDAAVFDAVRAALDPMGRFAPIA